MAKPIPCELHLNTAMGRLAEPIRFESVAAAVRFARGSGYFAYRVFDMSGRLIRRGFCR